MDPTLGETEATVGYSWKVWGMVPVASAMYAPRSTTGTPSGCGKVWEGVGRFQDAGEGTDERRGKGVW